MRYNESYAIDEKPDTPYVSFAFCSGMIQSAFWLCDLNNNDNQAFFMRIHGFTNKLLVILLALMVFIFISKYGIDTNILKGTFSGMIPPEHEVLYRNLTYRSYRNILNNRINIRGIHLEYHYYNVYGNYENHDARLVKISSWKSYSPKGSRFDHFYMYQGLYIYKNKLKDEYINVTPEVPYHRLKAVYDYIDENKKYFFSGPKYIGFEHWDHRDINQIGYNEYGFQLSFTIPGETLEYWTILKCNDKPDPVLEGLLSILENEVVCDYKKN